MRIARRKSGKFSGKFSGTFKERNDMTSKSKLYLGAAAIAAVLAGSAGGLSAQQAPAVAIDNDDIGGVVTGASEPEAAKYYPAIYWYSMLKIPDASQFVKKDGEIPEKVKQTDWLNLMKNNGCVG